MKIKIKKGRHCEGDKIFEIESKGSEAFSLYSFLILTNQLSLNETNKYKEYLLRGNPLYFEEAVRDVINLGRNGVDLLDDKQEYVMENICKKYKLLIGKFKQTKMEEFEI